MTSRFLSQRDVLCSPTLTHYSNLEEWKAKYKEQNDVILERYSSMETKNSYVNFQKALYAEKYGHPQEAENWWKVCAHDCPGQLLTQAVDIAVRNRFLLNPLIERITIEEWDRCVQTLVEHIPQTDMDSFFKDIFPLLKDYPLCASKIRQYFLEKQLSRNALEHTELVKLLGRYCEGFTTAAKKYTGMKFCPGRKLIYYHLSIVLPF